MLNILKHISLIVSKFGTVCVWKVNDCLLSHYCSYFENILIIVYLLTNKEGTNDNSTKNSVSLCVWFLSFE